MNLFGERTVISLTWKTLSPLHIGTGVAEKFYHAAFANRVPHFSPVQRDAADRAFIPGSTLKGAMRSAMGPGESAQTLFGSKPNEGGQENASMGAMGNLLVYAATACHRPDSKQLPFHGGSEAKERMTGGYIQASTAVDGRSSTADDHKLFHREMVPPGTRFEMTMLLFADADCEAFKTLVTLLKTHGLRLGAGKSSGYGRMWLEKVVQRKFSLTSQGDLAPTSESNETNTLHAEGEPTFTLHCVGPFMVKDSSCDGEEASNRNNIAFAQRFDTHTPFLPPSSLRGALRARARWLARLHGIGEDLSAVDALFGTTERASGLQVNACDLSGGEMLRLDNVALDPFTAGPIDGKLFARDVFCDVTLCAHLECISTDATALSLYDKLLVDIGERGLRLGAGETYGFGWFEPVETGESQA